MIQPTHSILEIMTDDFAQLQAEAARAAADAAEARAQAAEARAAALQAQLRAASAVAPDEPTAAPAPAAGLDQIAHDIQQGYDTQENVLALGVLVRDTVPEPAVPISIPLRMLNRHGLVAGATGTGKTRTLQLMAEGLSASGVPVFLTDIKGDLTGLAEDGTASEKLTTRTQALGQKWEPNHFPLELFTLGGSGKGTPIRTTVTDFGPLLLSKVLGLNKTQESSLSLIFHWADLRGLPLLDLKDIRAVVSYLTSEEGKGELKEIGGISSATAGVILRQIAQLQAQGGDQFFGEPAFDTADLLRTTPEGKGVISSLELPQLSSQPALFSTFVMWLLADLFNSLPEVGDVTQPRLVFFFDEAHLLFNDASEAFLDQVVQTVRLIRSKGVGVFFVTQTPKDVPTDVLAQLGSRIQHALRAHTPDDATRLAQTVKTFPHSPFDLEKLLTELATGEAVITVLSESGAPTPVAPTRLYAPQSNMGVAAESTMAQSVAASALYARYGTAVDNESAYEMLTARLERQRAASEEHIRSDAAAKREEEARKLRAAEEQREAKQARAAAKRRDKALDSLLNSAARTIGREISRSIFGTRRR